MKATYGVVLICVAALSSGCHSACGPTNCTGCCDASDICQAPSADHCGAPGEVCSVCSAFEVCQEGVCGFAEASGGNGNGNGSGTTSVGSSSATTGARSTGVNSTGANSTGTLTNGSASTGTQTSGGNGTSSATSSSGATTAGISGSMGTTAGSTSAATTGSTGTTGSAVCAEGCPAGYQCSTGVCVGGDDEAIVLEVETVNVSGTVTLNGQAPQIGTGCASTYPYQAAGVSLVETTHGYSFSAAISCTDSQFSWSAVVFPGTYQVAVSGDGTNSNLPSTSYIVDTALPLTSATSGVNLDIETTSVSGTITLNGQVPQIGTGCASTYPYQAAGVSLVETTNGYSFSAAISCTDNQFLWNAVVFPGTYQVAVSGDGTNSNLPSTSYIVDDALPLTSVTSGVNLDIETTSVSGTITLNGQVPQIGTGCASTYPYQAAGVSLVETTHGYSFSAAISCTDSQFSWNAVVFPGTYQVAVSGDGTNSNLPSTSYIVDNALPLTSATSGVNLDIETTSVSGTITLNGQVPQIGTGCASTYPYQAAGVSLVETTHGYSFQAAISCTDTQFAWNAVVFPGTYQVAVSGDGTNSNLPSTTYIVDNALPLTSPTSGVNLDIETASVSGTLTLNGQVPQIGSGCASTYPYQAAGLSLVETTHGYSFTAAISCTDTQFAWNAVVFPGTYQVAVSGDGTNSNLPSTSYIVDDALALLSATSGVNFDVETTSVGGTITLNGQAPQIGTGCASTYPYQAAGVSLVETTHGYSFSAAVSCTDTQFTWGTVVFPGTYQVAVSGDGTNSDLPSTSYIVLDAIQVP